MPTKKLKEFLDSHNIEYVSISHPTVYTAQEIAAAAHISGRNMAKTVIVKLDGKMNMVVLPASTKIDLELLKEATGASTVELAMEHEFKDLFPGCTIGAMPPFGNLYGLDVLAAQALAEDEEIAFNAGSHSELMKLRYKDYEQLVKPKVFKLSVSKERV
jgi:Ala-tRNA(Pro) deacylase